MTYLEMFKEFWNKKGQYMTISNPKRNYEAFCRLYSSVKNEYDIADTVEKYIVDHKAFVMQKVHEKFCDYLNIDNNIRSKDLKITNVERQLYILRDSQRAFKISELSDKYDIVDVRPDVDALKDGNGISFLGTEIVPNIKYIGGNKYIYEDTVHPLFLALNLTEVNTLLKLLPDFLSKVECTDGEKKMIKLSIGLLERMQYQLSDYALERLGLEKKDMSNQVLRFIPESEMRKAEEGNLMYWIKRMEKNQRITIDGSKEYIGTIKMDDNGYYILTTEEKKIRIDNLDTLSFRDY